ncbi:hypothetical protein E2C01_086398 [Portunus trituberculatus]|uniref:Uncharacterized protein n=1 Tax=Portunus trituberculatus TaxID=210409 RepID=A0A5B7JDC8_PORTR|nr:hypothetical protein [Portunus trituberculatus]
MMLSQALRSGGRGVWCPPASSPRPTPHAPAPPLPYWSSLPRDTHTFPPHYTKIHTSLPLFHLASITPTSPPLLVSQ